MKEIIFLVAVFCIIGFVILVPRVPDDPSSSHSPQRQLMDSPDILLGNPIYLDVIKFRVDNMRNSEENDMMLVWIPQSEKEGKRIPGKLMPFNEYVKEKHKNHKIQSLRWDLHQRKVYIIYQKNSSKQTEK